MKGPLWEAFLGKSLCDLGQFGIALSAECVPFGAGRSALRGCGLEDGPGSEDRRGAARVPCELPWLDGPREVCELPVAHVNTDRVEPAYRRTDLFERRRALMEQWGAFLTANEAKVVRP